MGKFVWKETEIRETQVGLHGPEMLGKLRPQ